MSGFSPKQLAQLVVVLLLVAIFSGFFVVWIVNGTGFAGGPALVSRKNGSSFSGDAKFINPTVLADVGKHYIINFNPLREQILAVQKKYAQTTYIYFLYLNNSAWIGVNEKIEFTAASTVKVPLAMATLKFVEEGKLKLSDSYGLNDFDLESGFGELYKAGPGTELTLEELLKIMLEQSDNTAAMAIQSILSNLGAKDPLADIYAQFGWADFEHLPFLGESEKPKYIDINLKTLSNMFLALYNAAYLSTENSQRILSYLAITPFNDKIAAGVPEAIPVSHKIGISEGDETFSDCGIVYVPTRNYLLCLGSNGDNEQRAAEFMAEISKIAYDYVINN